jgi:hypothetical protein
VYVNGQLHENLNELVRVPLNGMVYGVLDHDITVVPYRDQ